MEELFKQLLTPAIITAFTALISGIYAYFQKKKEEYRKYVYENKQEDFKKLIVYAEEIAELSPESSEKIKKLLFKISQRINPYGRRIKTFGLYQWVRDDGYIWFKIDDIGKKIKEGSVESEDLEELAHRIQVSKRLLDVKIEKDASSISSSQLWFYFLQYSMLLLQFLLGYFLFQQWSNAKDEYLITSILILSYCLLVSFFSLLILPELIVGSGDNDKKTIMLEYLLIPAVDAWSIVTLSSDRTNSVKSISLGIGLFLLFSIIILSIVILKSTIFGKSEVGKVSTIYKFEYASLQSTKEKGVWKSFIEINKFCKKGNRVE
jgi:hypothetical protein